MPRSRPRFLKKWGRTKKPGVAPIEPKSSQPKRSDFDIEQHHNHVRKESSGSLQLGPDVTYSISSSASSSFEEHPLLQVSSLATTPVRRNLCKTESDVQVMQKINEPGGSQVSVGDSAPATSGQCPTRNLGSNTTMTTDGRCDAYTHDDLIQTDISNSTCGILGRYPTLKSDIQLARLKLQQMKHVVDPVRAPCTADHDQNMPSREKGFLGRHPTRKAELQLAKLKLQQMNHAIDPAPCTADHDENVSIASSSESSLVSNATMPTDGNFDTLAVDDFIQTGMSVFTCGIQSNYRPIFGTYVYDDDESYGTEGTENEHTEFRLGNFGWWGHQ